MKHVYLDYAATTPMDPRVIEEFDIQMRENYGNSSSLHDIGQKAAKTLLKSREVIASLIGAPRDDIIFTSSGTEADNLAILGVANKHKKRGNHIISTAIEHHAIEKTCELLEKQGFKVTYLPVDNQGLIDLKLLEESITDNTILISIMFANNEIGTIEPIRDIGRIAKKYDVIFHTDAIQAVGKIPINVEELHIDLLSASAHKLYGPKGVGMLYTRNKGNREGWGKILEPIMHGGGHERDLRPSTMNVPAIAAFAKAAEIAKNEMPEEIVRETKLRDKIIKSILHYIDDSYLNGHPTSRLPNNVNLGFKYVEGESIVLDLDAMGIGTSTGSACSSKSLEPSHVLLAIGLSPQDAHGSLRISLGRFTSEDEVDYFLEQIPLVIERLRKISPLYKKMKEK